MGQGDSGDAPMSVVSSTGTGTALGTTSAHKVEDSSGSCHVTGLADTGVTAATGYTPIGTEVEVNASGNIAGCEFSGAGSVFNAGGLGGLVEIVLQAAGLAPPIALLFALGSFGTSFMRNMGSHPILAAVLTVIMLLLVATLLNTFVPFLTDAFEAIDKNRFIMYDEGLGAISTVVGNFMQLLRRGRGVQHDDDRMAGHQAPAWRRQRHFRSQQHVDTVSY